MKLQGVNFVRALPATTTSVHTYVVNWQLSITRRDRVPVTILFLQRLLAYNALSMLLQLIKRNTSDSNRCSHETGEEG